MWKTVLNIPDLYSRCGSIMNDCKGVDFADMKLAPLKQEEQIHGDKRSVG